MNIDEIKKLVKQSPKFKRVNDVLALTPVNDPFYIQKNQIEKAEWFAEVWKREEAISDWEDGLIHPRGLHYQILGKGDSFTIKIGGKDKKITYENTEQCWNYLKMGAKYSRLLGLVPYEKIKDEQNPPPIGNPIFNDHNEFKVMEMNINNDVLDIQLPYLIYDDTESLIEARIDKIMELLFKDVNYSSRTEQPNYLEIWAEKSGVIPMSIAREFNAEVKPAGGGEFSVDMCFKAIEKAKKLDKDLHIFVLSDFDPKGMDMPKSVARKVEFIAKQLEATAFVHHVALTKEQCIKHTLPTVPAKKPKGNSTGYLTHIEIFKKFAGQDPTELNSFQAREPIIYKETIRKAVEPYYDKELANKFREERKRLEDSIRGKLKAKFEELREDLDKIREIINNRFDKLNKVLEPIIEKKYGKLDLDKHIKAYEELINFEVSEIIEDESFEFPNIIVESPKNALLDTRRSYLEQLAKYKEFDMRG